eukprot:1939147-Rhodomonas_salina.2
MSEPELTPIIIIIIIIIIIRHQSAIPVLNALIILLMVTAIYALMGVFLFAERSIEKFGDFGRSMYTMFELLAFAEWRGMPGAEATTCASKHAQATAQTHPESIKHS